MTPERLTNMGDISWGEAGADHMARYLFASAYVPGKKTLDVGTGLGYGAALLKAYGASEVDAFDIDPDITAKARQMFGKSGINFFVSDSQTFDRSGKRYDLICSFENIEHIPDPVAFVRAARAALNPGGVLLCSTPARERDPEFVNGKPKNPYHMTEWFRGEFRDLIGTAFDQIDMYSQVEAFSLLKRRQGVEALTRILRHPLRGSVLHNLTRLVLWASDRLGFKSVRKRAKMGADISGLECPSIGDFPVIHSTVEHLFGVSFGHMVVCKV